MNLFLLIKNFSKAKWVFSRPKNRKYLIYDSGHSNYLFQYIKKRMRNLLHKMGRDKFVCFMFSRIDHGLVNLHTNYKKIFFNCKAKNSNYYDEWLYSFLRIKKTVS